MDILVTHTYRDKGIFTKLSVIRKDNTHFEVEQLFMPRNNKKHPQVIRYPYDTLEELFKNWPGEFAFEELIQ